MGNNKKVYKTKYLDNSIKDIDEKKGIITGYLSSFETIDKVRDIVDKKFFNKTLADKGNQIPFLFNHNWNETIGRFDVLKADSKGLYYEKNLLKTYNVGGKEIVSPVAQKVLVGVIENIMNKNSFGYRVIKEVEEKSNGEIYNRLLEGELHEGSILSVEACNDNAIVTGLKSFEKSTQIVKIAELQEEITKLQKGKITKEKYFIMKMMNLQLKQMIIDFQLNDIEPSKQTPTVKDEDKKSKLYLSIY